MATLLERFTAFVKKGETETEKLRNIINGPESAYVKTEAGQVPTVSKSIRDNIINRSDFAGNYTQGKDYLAGQTLMENNALFGVKVAFTAVNLEVDKPKLQLIFDFDEVVKSCESAAKSTEFDRKSTNNIFKKATLEKAETEALVNAFSETYLGGLAADPTQGADGKPLKVGALYWNTTESTFKTWSGGTWHGVPALRVTPELKAESSDVPTSGAVFSHVETSTQEAFSQASSSMSALKQELSRTLPARAARYGLYFEGKGYASVPSIAFGSGDFALSGWVRPTAPGCFVSYGKSNSSRLELAYEAADGFTFTAVGEKSVRVKSGSLPTQNWYHVLAQKWKNDIVLKVNGLEVARETVPLGAVSTNVAQGCLGAILNSQKIPTQHFTGSLSQVLFFTRALSSREALRLYETPCAFFPGGARAAYRLDEGLGYQLRDSSASRLDGALSEKGWHWDRPQISGHFRALGVDVYDKGNGNSVRLVSGAFVVPRGCFIDSIFLKNNGKEKIENEILILEKYGTSSVEYGKTQGHISPGQAQGVLFNPRVAQRASEPRIISLKTASKAAINLSALVNFKQV